MSATRPSRVRGMMWPARAPAERHSAQIAPNCTADVCNTLGLSGSGPALNRAGIPARFALFDSGSRHLNSASCSELSGASTRREFTSARVDPRALAISFAIRRGEAVRFVGQPCEQPPLLPSQYRSRLSLEFRRSSRRNSRSVFRPRYASQHLLSAPSSFSEISRDFLSFAAAQVCWHE